MTAIQVMEGQLQMIRRIQVPTNTFDIMADVAQDIANAAIAYLTLFLKAEKELTTKVLRLIMAIRDFDDLFS